MNDTTDSSAHLLFVDKNNEVPVDVVLGPKDACTWVTFLGIDAPLPSAEGEDAFQSHHLRARIGDGTWSVWWDGTGVRVVPGETYDRGAQLLPGWTGALLFDLVLASNGPRAAQPLSASCSAFVAMRVPSRIPNARYAARLYFRGEDSNLYSAQTDGGEAPVLLSNWCGALAAGTDGSVCFQGGNAKEPGLWKTPPSGSAQELDDRCGSSFAMAEQSLFFQGTSKHDALYRCSSTPGTAPTTDMETKASNIAASPDQQFVYFRRDNELWRIKVDGQPGTAKQVDSHCGDHFVVTSSAVFFQGGDDRKKLYRRALSGDAIGDAYKLDDNCGALVVGSDGYVYFQGTKDLNQLYRVPQDGDCGSATFVDDCCGASFAVERGWVYFQGGGDRNTLYARRTDGTGTANQLDGVAANIVTPGDGYVYYVRGGVGGALWRVPEQPA